MTKIKVTGCKDCPFHTDCFVFGRCEAKDRKTITYNFDDRPITPTWCPLKKEPITIEIDEINN